MSIQELEQQLLQLEPSEQLHIIQLLTQNLLTHPAIRASASNPSISPDMQTHTNVPPANHQRFNLVNAIARFRQKLLADRMEIDPETIWGDVRDRAPVADQPQW